MKAFAPARRFEIATALDRYVSITGKLVPSAERIANELHVSKWTAIKFYYQLIDNRRRGIDDPLAPDSAFRKGSVAVNTLRQRRHQDRMKSDDEYAERQRRLRHESSVRHYTPYSTARQVRDLEYFLKRTELFARGRARKEETIESYAMNWQTLERLWFQQQGVCPVSGIVMDYRRDARHPLMPSLDRIDPRRGYTEENVRWVCYFVNLLKRDFEDREAVELLRIAHAYQTSKAVEVGPLPSPERVRAKILTSVRNARRRSCMKDWTCDLAPGDLLTLYRNQDGRCALSGVIMSPAPLSSRSISVDRIDSSRSYEVDNIQLVCLGMNIAKLDHDQTMFEEVLRQCSI